MVYSNTAVYGGNEYGKSNHLSIFTSLKHLTMFLKTLHLIRDADSVYGHAAQIFQKLNIDAFNKACEHNAKSEGTLSNISFFNT